MQVLLTIVVFLLIFSFLILIHELGHFMAAKRSGIRVDEFGLGMPPRIWGKKKGETIYSVNWIPFGGFVRMLGEDPRDPEAKKSKRSFQNRPLRQRMFVAIAGVLMNLLFAFIFLTFGFLIGIEPLIVTTDDFLDGIQEGQVVTEPGFYVYNVDEGSTAHYAGFEVGDKVVSRNGVKLTGLQQFYSLGQANEEGDAIVFELLKLDGSVEEVELLMTSDYSLGLDLYLFELPRVAVYEATIDTGLQGGDVVLSVNGEEVFYMDEYERALYGATEFEYEVYRDGEVEMVSFSDYTKTALVSDVLSGSPAEEAGLMEGDLILSVDGQDIYRSSEILDVTLASEGGSLEYVVSRDGSEISFDVSKGEDGLVGIYITDVWGDSDISLYETVLTTSVIEILPERHGFVGAPTQAVKELGRLSVLTVDMIGDLFSGIVSRGEISDNVAGPVGIAQMTYVFLQDGFAAIIRFLALLSLALAVFNIIPFPALDGGRLVFLFFEAFTGRKPNPKVEAVIHSLGFFLLMLLIVAVTFKDVLRLFGV